MSDQQRRILEVLFSFRVGGSEVVGLDLAEQLSAAGYRVLCTALDGLGGPLRKRCNDLNIEIVDLGLPMQGLLSRNGFSLQLAHKLKALRLDAIHLQHFLGLNKLGLAARMARIPRIVVTEHSDADLRTHLNGRLRLRANWRLATHITVIHNGIRTYLEDHIGVRRDRLHVIPNGINFDVWHRRDRDEIRGSLGIRDEFTFLYVGRLARVKQVPALIRAFIDFVATSKTPARLLIVGSGEELAACQSAASSSPDGDKVTFCGEQLDVRRFMAAADAFVMNSESEGTPRAMLEAMAIGVPCIAPAVGGIPEMLNGRGYLVPSKDCPTLTDGLFQAASNPDRTLAYAKRALEFSRQNYDSKTIVKSYIRLLSH